MLSYPHPRSTFWFRTDVMGNIKQNIEQCNFFGWSGIYRMFSKFCRKNQVTHQFPNTCYRKYNKFFFKTLLKENFNLFHFFIPISWSSLHLHCWIPNIKKLTSCTIYMFSEKNVSLEFIAQLLYMEVTVTHSNITFQPIYSSTVTEVNVHLVISGDDESAFSPYDNKKNSSCNATLYIDLFWSRQRFCRDIRSSGKEVSVSPSFDDKMIPSASDSVLIKLVFQNIDK